MVKVGFVVALRALVIIGRSFDDNNKQLYRACKELIRETYLARIMNMSASISSDGSRFWVGYREVKDIDVCFLRSFDAGSYEQIIRRIGLVRHLSETGTFVVNPLEPLLMVRDKYSTLFTLARHGLPIPETYVTESAYWAYRKTQKFKQTVYKPISGALGFGAMKFDDSDLAFNAYKRLEELSVPLYVQEYLENQQRDIRAFVVGDKIVAAMHRIASKNSWKTNIALGNEPKPLQLPKNLANMAVKATKALGLIYAGVDMLETKNGPVLLEVNGSPSWQGLGRVSGVDVAKVLVEHVLSLIRR